MSWSDKPNNAIIILFIFGFVFLGACQEDEGFNIDAVDQRSDVNYVEFVLPSQSIYLDSLRTDNQDELVVGEYGNDIFGKVRAESYVSFIYSSGINAFDETSFFEKDIEYTIKNFTYKDAKATFDVNGIVSDNLNIANKNLSLYELKDSVFSNILYLRDKQLTKGDLIGSTEFFFNHLEKMEFDVDTLYYPIEVEISEAFGKQLLEGLKKSGSSYTPPSVALTADQSDILLALDLIKDTTKIMMNINADVVEKVGGKWVKDTVFTTTFRFLSSRNFVHIDRNRQGSKFENIENLQSLDLQDGQVYINHLAGIYPKISLENFIDFAVKHEKLMINRAYLEIETQQNKAAIPVIPSLIGFLGENHSKNAININWPDMNTYPNFYGMIIQTNTKYQAGGLDFEQENFMYDSLESGNQKVGFEAYPTRFFQALYNAEIEKQKGVAIDSTSLLNEALRNKKYFILMPTLKTYVSNVKRVVDTQYLKIGQSSLVQDNIKLKLYYTSLKK